MRVEATFELTSFFRHRAFTHVLCSDYTLVAGIQEQTHPPLTEQMENSSVYFISPGGLEFTKHIFFSEILVKTNRNEITSCGANCL